MLPGDLVDCEDAVQELHPVGHVQHSHVRNSQVRRGWLIDKEPKIHDMGMRRGTA